MAKYRVTGPDGATYEVSAPDGASEQEIIAYAQKQVPAAKPEAPAASRGVLGVADDITRMVASGGTFGGADEFAAKMDETIGRGTYAENVERERARDADIMERMPIMATVAKITGAVANPITRYAGATRLTGMAGNAIQGLVGGALTGFGESTEGNRLSGAATGGILGAGAGAALPAAINGVTAAVRSGVNRFSAPATQFGRRLMTALERDGLSIDDAMNYIRGLGDDTAIADLGGNVRGFAEAVANMPGRAAHAADELRQRTFRQGERIVNGALRILGVNSMDDLVAQRSAAAAPLYERALGSRVPVTSARIERLVQNPEIQRGIQAGVRVLRNEADATGIPLRLEDYGITAFNEAGDPVITGVPTLRLLDAAKRGLDDTLASGGERVRNPTTNRLTQYGRSIEQLRSSLVRELDSLTDGTYREAREAWSGPSDVIEALGLINRTVERARDGSDVTGRLFGSQESRNTLRRLFPDDESFGQFTNLMNNERTKAETTRAITGNSRTAYRQAAQDELSGDGIDAAFNVAQNPSMGNMVVQGGNMLRNWWRRPPSAVADEATPLFSTDPAVQQEAFNALRNRTGGQQLLDRIVGPRSPNLLRGAAAVGGQSGGQLGSYR